MNFQVLLTRRAERELHEAADWIARSSPESAQKWFDGFVETLASLEENPERCSLAREDALFPFQLRQILYGRRRNHRALFAVQTDAVVVLSIRHSAQQDLTPEDFAE